jgi:hypothetical protein
MSNWSDDDPLFVIDEPESVSNGKKSVVGVDLFELTEATASVGDEGAMMQISASRAFKLYRLAKRSSFSRAPESTEFDKMEYKYRGSGAVMELARGKNIAFSYKVRSLPPLCLSFFSGLHRSFSVEFERVWILCRDHNLPMFERTHGPGSPWRWPRPSDCILRFRLQTGGV